MDAYLTKVNIMKKFAYLMILSGMGTISFAAHAQNFRSEQFSTANVSAYAYTQSPIASVSNSQTMAMGSPFDAHYSPIKQNQRGLFINQLNSSKIHFSKSGKLDYGVSFNTERQIGSVVEGNSSTLGNAEFQSSFSTSAFANYRINSNYALGSSITYGNGKQNGTQLSIAAKANRIFNKRHELTAVFSVNWNSSANLSKSSLSASDWRQSQQFLSLNANSLNRTELRIGSSWNWNIDTNWTLSTGINASHQLTSPAKNPFVTQRTPVTIFSVATYRF
jgi:hypothetical protein